MTCFNQNSDPCVSKNLYTALEKIKHVKTIYTSSHIEKLIDKFKDLLLTTCGILCYSENKITTHYSTYITSGNSESNKNYIHTIITAFKALTKKKPHVIVCQTDSVELLTFLAHLKVNDTADIDFLPVNIQGNSTTHIIEKNIKPGNTCLIIIGAVNSIFCNINNIKKISDMAHKYNIPVHVDYNYIFCNEKINPQESGADSFIMDFSKITPLIKNFGIICIKYQLLQGYRLQDINEDFKIDINYKKIDPINLNMANTIIAYYYKNKNTRISAYKKIYNHIIKELYKKYKTDTFINYIKNQSNRPDIILLHNDYVNPLNSISFIIYDETKYHKFIEKVHIDTIDPQLIKNYKAFFTPLFIDKKNVDILDRLVIISWNETTKKALADNIIKAMGDL